VLADHYNLTRTSLPPAYMDTTSQVTSKATFVIFRFKQVPYVQYSSSRQLNTIELQNLKPILKCFFFIIFKHLLTKIGNLQRCKLLLKTVIQTFIHPGSRFSDAGSRIPNLTTARKKEEGEKFTVLPFFVATNITKMKIILILNSQRK
jgi:hypothetical protein